MSFFDDASLVMIPSGYKDQKVYSVKPTDGTGDLTFSRASSATRVQSNGLIEKVRTNVLTYSQTFSDASWLIGTGQTKTQSQIDPNGGTTAVLISNVSEANGYMSKALTLTANVPNTFSIYIKGAASGSVSLRLDDSTAGPQFDINYTTSWQRFSVTRTVDQASCFLTVGGYSTWAIGENIQFAFAQVETGDIATAYIPTTTAAVSVGPVSGLPRLDYLGSTCPKLLLEPQRTNLAIYSEQFDNAGWGKTQSGTGLVPVITANNAISPDGYQNADTIVFDVGAGTTSSDISAMFQTFGGTTATYTGSFYAKTASGTAQIQVRIDGSNYDKFTITNQWQRFTLTKALTGTSNVFEMAIRRGLNEPMNASATIQLWGVQVELGAYATSYIPTLGASVTRVADAASKTSASALIGQTEGTIFWEFEFTTSVATGNEALLNIDNGSFGNTVYISKSASGGIVAEMYNGGVLQASLSLSSQPAGTYKAAIGYANNNTAFFVNGVQVGTTDTSCSVPAMSRIQLGNTAIGPSTDKTAQVLLFTTRLTNAQLAELTA